MTHVGGAAISANKRAARPAPISRRFAAFVLDEVLVALPLIVAEVTRASNWTIALAFVASVVLSIANGVVLVVRSGQSVGRRVFALKVLDSNRMTPPGAWQVIWRNTLAGPGIGFAWHPISALPGFIVILSPWPLICYGTILFDRRWRRGLHDRWSRTVVVDALS